jgi:glycosyltransferase involved in cell wall biosynthesis
MKPFFSIVIPTLNEERYLPKLLTDLTKQKERSFEVIVADSYSKDKTKEIALIFKKNFPLIFTQVKKKNVASQRNYGAGQTQGKYLIFLDADTRINPTFFKKVKKTIEKKKGLIFLPYFFPDREYKQYKPLFDFTNLLVELSQNFPKRFSLGGSMIVEKEFFKLIGGFNKKLYISEDHELIQRASQWGVKPKFIKEARTYFSLRRMKKEGQLRFFYKSFVALAYRLLSGEATKKLFEYKMGGQLYSESEPLKKKQDWLDNYLKQIKNLFKKILED